MMSPREGCGGPPPLTQMTVMFPGLTGIESMGNALNICSLFPAQYGRGKERGKCKIMRAVRAPVFYPKRCMPAVFPMGEFHVDLRGRNPASSQYRGVCIIGSGR